MANLFFISDTHFNHEKSLTFKRDDGSPLRDFSSCEEMDETMVKNWNSVVRPQDHIYHLGDVAISRSALIGKPKVDEYGVEIQNEKGETLREPSILSRLNGHKRLVRGNHDIFRTADYLKYFEEIYGVRVFPEHKIICSHIPLHPQSVQRWAVNVHGHLHANTYPYPYVNVAVEQINYTPISLEDLLKKIKIYKEGVPNDKDKYEDEGHCNAGRTERILLGE